MKTALLASAMLMGFMAHASAYNIAFDVPNGPLPGTYAPAATGSSGAYDQNVTNSISGVRLSPFAGSSYDGRAYDAVEANGSATFAASSFGQSSGSGGIFTFVYGSPDTYNTLTFSLGGMTVASLTGANIGPTPSSGYSFVQINNIGAYDSVTFGTMSTNAFEFAAVSAVPLPASLPMFGGALLALAGFSYGMNRWVAPKGKVAKAAA